MICGWQALPSFNEYSEVRGSLFTMDTDLHLKRIYYIDTDGLTRSVKRGGHAHFHLQQKMFCLRGKVDIYLESSWGSEEVELRPGGSGLWLGCLVWREFWLAPGSLLVVTCDRRYESNDYIYSKNDWRKYFD